MIDISYIAINRMVEQTMATDKKYRKAIKKSGRITLSEARKMSDLELLEKLRSFNVSLDRETFGKSFVKFLSAEEMSEWIIRRQI